MSVESVEEKIDLIINETKEGGNTRQRVGSTFQDLLNLYKDYNGDYILRSGTKDDEPITGTLTMSFQNLTANYGSYGILLAPAEGEGNGTILRRNELLFNNGYKSISSVSGRGIIIYDNLDYIGIVGEGVYDKKGDRRAYAQMGDVYDNAIPQIKITTSSSITIATKAQGTVSQHGKNVLINNGSANINLTINTDGVEENFCATYIKMGTGIITIRTSGGAFASFINNTGIVDGIIGSRFMISRDSGTNEFKVYTSNFYE